MATQDIKEYLFQQTGIAQSQWKRLSKHKNPEGLDIRIFQDKVSGKVVETLEDKNGEISILGEISEANINTSPKVKAPSEDKQTKNLIKKFCKSFEAPDDDKPGFKNIPKYFKFCFLEDSNVDHTQELEEAAKALDPKVSVAGFNIFFTPTFAASEDVIHLGPLLAPFLPDFLGETEEASFAVHPEVVHIYDEERVEGLKDGTIPNIPYDQLVATLESVGFTYDPRGCMLSALGGSKGAKPFEVQNTNSGLKPKFCLLAVKNQNYYEGEHSGSQYITALVVDTQPSLSRNDKEKLVNKTLKKYHTLYPGRLMHNALPQIELVQLMKKGFGSRSTFDEDRAKIYNSLIEAGWELDESLASEENAKKWTLEQWAVTPIPADPFIKRSPSKVSDTASEIEYYIWKPSGPRPKP